MMNKRSVTSICDGIIGRFVEMVGKKKIGITSLNEILNAGEFNWIQELEVRCVKKKGIERNIENSICKVNRLIIVTSEIFLLNDFFFFF